MVSILFLKSILSLQIYGKGMRTEAIGGNMPVAVGSCEIIGITVICLVY
jgi:hypothetical protein